MSKGTEQTFSQRRHADGQQVYENTPNITNHQGSANQNHNITSHLSEWWSAKRRQVTAPAEAMEKREPWYTAGEKVN